MCVFANVRTFGREMRIGREFERWTTQAFRQLTKKLWRYEPFSHETFTNDITYASLTTKF